MGAITVQEAMGLDAVVTVFSDCHKKYLNTTLMKEEPVAENFLSCEIELMDYRTPDELFIKLSY